MRMTMLAVVGATSILSGAAVLAQAPSQERAPASPGASSPQAPAEAPAIKSVSVIELNELPEGTRAQVNDMVANRSADDLQRLQKAIEGAPTVKSAVEAKGFSARDVVVAQVNEQGELIVITRRAG